MQKKTLHTYSKHFNKLRGFFLLYYIILISFLVRIMTTTILSNHFLWFSQHYWLPLRIIIFSISHFNVLCINDNGNNNNYWVLCIFFCCIVFFDLHFTCLSDFDLFTIKFFCRFLLILFDSHKYYYCYCYYSYWNIY